MDPKTKAFDCVAESRKWREAASAKLNAMSTEEELAYLKTLGERVRSKLGPRPTVRTPPASAIQPKRGFDCVAMKHRAQERIHRETEGMTDDEVIAYFNRAGRAFRETGRIPSVEAGSMVLREEPPADGGK